jgi:integrase
MNTEIKVHVIDYSRKNLYMRYVDPVTGKQSTRSTGTHKRKEAERIAHKWEADLQEGRYKAPSKVGWHEFRIRYEDEVLSGLADKTAEKASGTFNAIERILNPQKLASLTADRISYHQSQLRAAGRSESTIKGHMAHLQASLNWAHGIGLLNEVPKIDMPKRAKRSKKMKGRPATTEEFERMLDKTPSVVGKRAASSWRYYLRGMWWSGLRLTESLELYWDRDDKLCVDLTGKFPMLHIPAELEKGHQDRLHPIAPEFAEFLLATPEADRTGRVFAPMSKRDDRPPLLADRVGILASQIGKAANVKVSTDPKTGKVKFASIHDLRRSFGERWAPRVMPQVLMELMRHESIETTLKYYVGRNAETTAAALYEAVQGNTLGNSLIKSPSDSKKTFSETDALTRLTKHHG